MPRLLVPPTTTMVAFLTPLTDLAKELQNDNDSSSPSNGTHERFLEFCNLALDNEELYFATECFHCCVLPTLIDPLFEKFGSLATAYLAAAASAAKSEGAASCPEVFSAANMIDVMHTIKLFQLLRNVPLGIPLGLLLHADPRIRYEAFQIGTGEALPLSETSEEFPKLAEFISFGHRRSDGSSIPPLHNLVEMYMSNPEDSGDVVRQIWECRVRLLLASYCGAQCGSECLVPLIERNPGFFSEELMSLCPHAAKLAASSDPLLNGIVSDIFGVFELAFLDMSLFPTPEVLRQMWANMGRLLSVDTTTSSDQQDGRRRRPTYRNHGEVLYSAFRALQFQGGFLTRHEGPAIAKEKVRLLSTAEVSDPFGRFGFTLSQCMDDALSNGLFETLVKLFYRSVRFVNETCGRSTYDDAHMSPPRRAVEVRLYMERLNVLSNILDFIFRSCSSHGNVVPVLLLSYKAADDSMDLLDRMLELLAARPTESMVVMNLLALAGALNARDIPHRLIAASVFPKLLGIDQQLKRNLLISSSSPDINNNEQVSLFGEFILFFVKEAMSAHADGKEEIRKHAHMYADFLVEFGTSRRVFYAGSITDAATIWMDVLPFMIRRYRDLSPDAKGFIWQVCDTQKPEPLSDIKSLLFSAMREHCSPLESFVDLKPQQLHAKQWELCVCLPQVLAMLKASNDSAMLKSFIPMLVAVVSKFPTSPDFKTILNAVTEAWELLMANKDMVYEASEDHFFSLLEGVIVGDEASDEIRSTIVEEAKSIIGDALEDHPSPRLEKLLRTLHQAGVRDHERLHPVHEYILGHPRLPTSTVTFVLLNWIADSMQHISAQITRLTHAAAAMESPEDTKRKKRTRTGKQAPSSSDSATQVIATAKATQNHFLQCLGSLRKYLSIDFIAQNQDKFDDMFDSVKDPFNIGIVFFYLTPDATAQITSVLVTLLGSLPADSSCVLLSSVLPSLMEHDSASARTLSLRLMDVAIPKLEQSQLPLHRGENGILLRTLLNCFTMVNQSGDREDDKKNPIRKRFPLTLRMLHLSQRAVDACSADSDESFAKSRMRSTLLQSVSIAAAALTECRDEDVLECLFRLSCGVYLKDGVGEDWPMSSLWDKSWIWRRFYQRSAKMVFHRLANVPASSANHLTVPLTPSFLSQFASSVLFPFALDATMFLIELQRLLPFDIEQKPGEEFLRWLKAEVTLVRVSVEAFGSNDTRPFVILRCPDLKQQGVSDALLHHARDALKFWCEKGMMCFNNIHALSLFDSESDIPDSIQVTSIPSQAALLQRSLTAFAERFVDIIILRVEALVELRGTELLNALSVFSDECDHLLNAMNYSFISDYLQRSERACTVLGSILKNLPLMLPRGCSEPSFVSLLTLIRNWASGVFLPKNVTADFVLDVLGNPTVPEEDDDDFEDVDDDDDDDAEEAIPDDAQAVNDGSVLANPISASLEAPRPPQKYSSILKTLITKNEAVEVTCCPGSANPADCNPYHYLHPPKTVDELVAMFYRCPLSIEEYATLHFRMLGRLSSPITKAAYANIGLVALPTVEMRRRVVAAVQAELQRTVTSQPERVGILLNVLVSCSSRFISGIRRAANDQLVEYETDNQLRCSIVRTLVDTIALRPSIITQKIVSIVMRLMSQTQTEPATAPECAWTDEHASERCDIPFHPHPLEYLSVGNGDSPCCICRGESNFYHYGCRECREFSCCIACVLQLRNPQTRYCCVRSSQSSVDRISVVLRTCSGTELVAFLKTFLGLIAHPTFPCERMDGATQVVQAVFDAGNQMTNEDVPQLLLSEAWKAISPATQAFLSCQERRLALLSKNTEGEAYARLADADLSAIECTPGFYLHHLLWLVIEQDKDHRAASCDELVLLLQQMVTLAISMLTILGPIVGRVRNHDIAFSSSPANVLFFAVCARAVAVADSVVALRIAESIDMPMARQESGSFTLTRTETQAMVSEANEPSIIFKQVAPDHRTRDDMPTNECISSLSFLAIRYRAVLNFYVRNCENPSQLLDAGLNYLLDAPHLDFAVREKLLRSRIDELGLSTMTEIELNVERDNLLTTSFAAAHAMRTELQIARVAVRVTFDDEEAVDEGGVTREWITLFFQELCKEGTILQPVGEAYQLASGPVDSEKLVFECIGTMIGFALCQNVPIEPHFSRALYKHMTGRQPGLTDLEASDPELYRNLMLVNKMATEDEFESLCLHFTTSSPTGEVELIPGGANIPVSNDNKKQYIKLVSDYVMTKCVQKRIKRVLVGMSRWLPLSWLTTFSAEEMELVCCGLPNIDVEDWRAHTRYEGYSPSSPQIRWFWDFIATRSQEERSRVLQFVRGSSKVPAAGFAVFNPPFTIVANCDSDRLPASHTCHNQLDLPAYSCEETLREKMSQALELGAIGFGMA